MSFKTQGPPRGTGKEYGRKPYRSSGGYQAMMRTPTDKALDDQRPIVQSEFKKPYASPSYQEMEHFATRPPGMGWNWSPFPPWDVDSPDWPPYPGYSDTPYDPPHFPVPDIINPPPPVITTTPGDTPATPDKFRAGADGCWIDGVEVAIRMYSSVPIVDIEPYFEMQVSNYSWRRPYFYVTAKGSSIPGPSKELALIVEMFSPTAGSHSQTVYVDECDSDVWEDLGEPDAAGTLIITLCFHNSDLYAGPFEGGHIYKYAGGGSWTDCGQPTGGAAYAFSSVSFDGNLYVGMQGNHVWRYDGGTSWTDMGAAAAAPPVQLAVNDGVMYASYYTDQSVFRFNSAENWTDFGDMGEAIRAIGSHDSVLYAGEQAGAGSGNVWRMNGVSDWTDMGVPGGALTIIYALVSDGSNLFASGTGSGNVYRMNGVGDWTSMGTPGSNSYTYAMIYHESKIYAAGSDGHVYRMDGASNWYDTGQVGDGDPMRVLVSDGVYVVAGSDDNHAYRLAT